ncbi:hypothetical protein Taro_028313 [Colocasia esculenta]|uniref:PH domain-containing protein n=1 Tax=Colocasia esculenta TaxID=4460 RepID=A0A843VGX8_COLES|nr:hypothetical protein [Colocasia esculenta]
MRWVEVQAPGEGERMSPGSAKMQGWLYLIRSNRFGLQYSRKRYFVLDGNSLNCFKSVPSIAELGARSSEEAARWIRSLMEAALKAEPHKGKEPHAFYRCVDYLKSSQVCVFSKKLRMATLVPSIGMTIQL